MFTVQGFFPAHLAYIWPIMFLAKETLFVVLSVRQFFENT